MAQDRSQMRLQGSGRVLLVGDEVLVGLMKLALNHGAYEVRSTTAIDDAERAIVDWRPHLAIIDIDLEQRRALDLVGRHAASGARLPVVAITRRGDLQTKLDTFEHGADDFLTAPFSPEELLARTLALMRRTYGERIPFVPTIRVGDIQIDILNQAVHLGKAKVQLTAIEQSLLYLLASNAGRVLTRETILDVLWGADYVAESNVIDRHVRNLRVKLRDDWRRPKYIDTVAGKGYRFLVPSTA
jgi:DNA-binding response OmpR family regulator